MRRNDFAAAERAMLATACALALGAAVSLGLARFSYALLLTPMRADLGWSYATAGAMNTLNAIGYLVGALAMPRVLARHDARAVLLAGAAMTAVVMAGHGWAHSDALLYALRLLAGIGSAATFVSGGLLAARLGQRPGARAALVLGLFYGGTGVGIIVSAVIVPPLSWRAAWWALALAAAACCVVMARGTRSLAATPQPRTPGTPGAGIGACRWALAGYLMFGLGYIGYMTFIVTLLREQGTRDPVIAAFYTVLGAGVLASSWLWAPLLQRARGGQALALLNALLALATLLPVIDGHAVTAFASGALFGAVFLSVVASTTAFVRHNLPPASWPSGITRFTIVFAAGQIVGPTLVGWLADGPGGLRQGLGVSAAMLAVGALLAWRQRPIGQGSEAERRA